MCLWAFVPLLIPTMLVTNPTACRALPNKPSLPQAVPLLVTGWPVRLPEASSLDILSLGVCSPVITYRFSRTAGDTMTRWVEGRMAREGPFPAGGHACAYQCMTLCLCHSRKPECEHTRATAQHTGQQPPLCPTALANALRGGQQGARTFGRTLPERLWPCAEGPSAAGAGVRGGPVQGGVRTVFFSRAPCTQRASDPRLMNTGTRHLHYLLSHPGIRFF